MFPLEKYNHIQAKQTGKNTHTFSNMILFFSLVSFNSVNKYFVSHIHTTIINTFTFICMNHWLHTFFEKKQQNISQFMRFYTLAKIYIVISFNTTFINNIRILNLLWKFFLENFVFAVSWMISIKVKVLREVRILAVGKEHLFSYLLQNTWKPERQQPVEGFQDFQQQLQNFEKQLKLYKVVEEF